MFILLRKIFIKDYKNINDPNVRNKHGLLASLFGIITNLLLFTFKLLIGILTLSTSIVADAINNLSDMGSSFINLFGFILSSKPADKKHPFGHQRIEYIAGLIISLLIIFLGVIMGYSSIIKVIKNEATSYNVYVFIILGVAIFVKLYQALFYGYISKLISSLSLKASAKDSFNDVISTSLVLIASLIEFFTKGKVRIDGYIGLVVSIYLLISGIKMVIETSNPLIGISLDHELVKKIQKEILSYEGVLGIHDTICHSYGPTSIYMSVHVEVDAKEDFLKSHELIDKIEHEVGNKFQIILTIHMDPVILDNQEINEMKKYLKVILDEYAIKGISFHDLRMVKGENRTNFIFDVLVPFDKKLNNDDLLKYIEEKIEQKDRKYHSIVKIDNDYYD